MASSSNTNAATELQGTRQNLVSRMFEFGQSPNGLERIRDGIKMKVVVSNIFMDAGNKNFTIHFICEIEGEKIPVSVRSNNITNAFVRSEGKRGNYKFSEHYEQIIFDRLFSDVKIIDKIKMIKNASKYEKDLDEFDIKGDIEEITSQINGALIPLDKVLRKQIRTNEGLIQALKDKERICRIYKMIPTLNEPVKFKVYLLGLERNPDGFEGNEVVSTSQFEISLSRDEIRRSGGFKLTDIPMAIRRVLGQKSLISTIEKAGITKPLPPLNAVNRGTEFQRIKKYFIRSKTE